MNYKEKLIDLLKTIPEIKEDIEELREFCKFTLKNKDGWLAVESSDGPWVFTICWNMFPKEEINEIYWNPLEERHLRIFCKNKGVFLTILENWLIDWEKTNEADCNTICKLNIYKNLDNQNEKVYEKLYYFFRDIKNV